MKQFDGLSIFIIGPNLLTYRLYMELGFKIVDDVESADLVHLPTGSDITPEFINEPKHPSAYPGDEKRQTKEVLVAYVGNALGKKLVGVGRGAQLLNILSGGGLWQHVDGHRGFHEVWDTETGEEFRVFSEHHQMMKPAKAAIELMIAQTSTTREEMAKDANGGRPVVTKVPLGVSDPECIYYLETSSLCFQPRLEHTSNKEVLLPYFAKYLDEYLLHDRG